MSPPVPAGTMAPLATIVPVTSFEVDTRFGGVWPVGQTCHSPTYFEPGREARREIRRVGLRRDPGTLPVLATAWKSSRSPVRQVRRSQARGEGELRVSATRQGARG